MLGVGRMFLILMMLSPCLSIIFLWAFTDYGTRSFSTWVWPLLGLVLLMNSYGNRNQAQMMYQRA